MAYLGIIVMVILILVGCFFIYRNKKNELKFISIKETIKKIIKKITYQQDIQDILVLKDPKSIYQNEEIVANIRGQVELNQSIIKIYDIIHAERLNLDAHFEYQNQKLQFSKRGPLCLTSFEDGILLGRTYEWLECIILLGDPSSPS